MIVELGHFALALGLAVACAQTALSAQGARRADGRMIAAGVAAAQVQTALLAAAFAALIYAFATSDFSVGVVVQHSHTDKPLAYKIAAAWGHHEGSMLLWVLLLAAFGALAARGREIPSVLKGWVLAVQGLISVLFTAFVVFTSNPFARALPAPLNGGDLNPLLQDPALAIHPPMLYVGYVGSSIVFAFAVAGLIQGRIDSAWARWARPWALISWTALTVGIGLGSYWAYYELGWGGWWYWDPVENASFMPWLLGAALIHSIIVTERRNALKGWTALLAILVFSLSMLGTFLVRSGVLTSVHAFALDPERGVFILAILSLLTGGGLALFAWRAGSLSAGGYFETVSRETAIVLNNLLLAVSCAAVLIGTLYPLLLEAATGDKISVGPPYFNLTFSLLIAPLLAAIPFGPLLAWREADAGAAARRLWIAAAAAAATAAAVAAARGAGPVAAALGVGAGVWLIVGAASEAAERVRLFQAPLSETRARLRAATVRSWASTVGHAGVGVLVLGVVGATAWRAEVIEAVAPGDAHRIAGFSVTYEGAAGERGPNYIAETGAFRVRRSGRDLGVYSPERRFYPAAGSSTTEVALRRGVWGDLYLVLGEAREGEARVMEARYFPLINLIYFGAGLMAVGGGLSLAGRRRPAPRTAASAAIHPQPAE